MRTQRRYPAGMLIMIPVLAGLGMYTLASGQPMFAGEPTPSPTAEGALYLTPADPGGTSTATPDASAIPPDYVATLTPEERAILYPSPSPTPTAVASHGAFHEGAWVHVNAGVGDCLNARTTPSMGEGVRVNFCLPDGYEGYLDGEGIEADGHWWWMLAGAGWVAEDYLTYVRDVSTGDALAPQLAGLGRIAFVRTSTGDAAPPPRVELWVMNANGSGQRMLVDLSRPDRGYDYPQNTRWSPDGTKISYSSASLAGEANGLPLMDLHVIDSTTGTQELTVPGVAGGAWSADGTKIGVVQGAQQQQMGGGWQGTPGWVDVATGAVHLLGAETFWQQDPPAWNFDGTLLLITRDVYAQDVSERSIRVLDATSGAEVVRIDAPKDVYYFRPQWAPTDNRIGFHVAGTTGDPHYAIYDVASHRVVAEAALPKRDPNIGGSCGGGGMWLLEWSRDGRQIAYTFSDGLTGMNGVWVWDVASGRQTLTEVNYPSGVSRGGGGRFAYGASGRRGYIFTADPNGGAPVFITDGTSPVWSPK